MYSGNRQVCRKEERVMPGRREEVRGQERGIQNKGNGVCVRV